MQILKQKGIRIYKDNKLSGKNNTFANIKIKSKYIILKTYVMQGYKKVILTALLVAFLIPVKSQNTDSPYSRYGYGILNNQSIGASRSMGGISYGLRELSSNPGNPASYTAIDSLTFVFDMGISYNSSRLTEGGTGKSYDNGGLDFLTMKLPLSKKLAVSVGLLPFSSVGYSFGSSDSESVSNTRLYSGSGGFSQLYGGAGYKIFDNLSVGANMSYIFGNTTYTRYLTVTGVPSANYQSLYHKLVLNLLRFDFGAQYTLPLNNKDNLTLGVVFSPATNSTGKIDRIYYEFPSGSTTPSVSDTTTYSGRLVSTDIPAKYGAGLTWKHKDNLVLGFDATYETWSKASYSEYMDDNMDRSDRFNDVWRFNAGFEYIADPKDRNFFKRVKVRGGASYSNSYINVMDSQNKISGYKEYGATLGFGIPVRDTFTGRSSYINLGFEYKHLKPDISNLIKEQYFGITLGVTFNDLWFMKNKLR